MSFASFVSVPRRNPDGSVMLDQKTGAPVKGIAVNPIKPHVRNYWLTDPDYGTIVLPASAGANQAGAARELNFLIDSQGHFDWASIVGVSTGNFTLEFFDPGTSHLLQNAPTHSRNIVGVAQRQFRLPEPYFFNVGDSQRQLKCKLRDLSGAENTVRLAMVGRRIYHKEAPPDVALDLERIFGMGSRTYSYFLNPTETQNDGTIDPVTANGTKRYIFESDASADSEVVKFMATFTGAFLLTFRERATNRLLMPAQIHCNNVFGNAEFPFAPADTYLLERQKQIIMEVQDLSGATNYIYPTLGCRRLQEIP